jgi:uncharacterized glyoxalase superfamily protein PhnB
MAKQTSGNRPNIFPALKYEDGPAAIDWLEKAFGFERGLVVTGEDGVIAHAELRLGAGHIMMGSAKLQPDPANPWDTADHGVYVYVEDIDAHYARAQAAGAQILRALADTPYGAREYSVHDLDGRLWSFGTYLPDQG